MMRNDIIVLEEQCTGIRDSPQRTNGQKEIVLKGHYTNIHRTCMGQGMAKH